MRFDIATSPPSALSARNARSRGATAAVNAIFRKLFKRFAGVQLTSTLSGIGEEIWGSPLNLKRKSPKFRKAFDSVMNPAEGEAAVVLK